MRTYRGSLARTSLRLEVAGVRHVRRSGWPGSLSIFTRKACPGSGIVYTLTKRDADQVAGFLSANGIAALAL